MEEMAESSNGRTFQTLISLLFFLTAASCQGSDIGNEVNAFSAKNHNISTTTRFLIYDVNPGEGFNLRRDVYIRVANLIKHMINRGEDWILVLPPWRHLYHWKSRYIEQEAVKWNLFFDIHNMNFYVPVMEFDEFLNLEGYSGIDHLLYLERHPDGFKNGWKEVIEFGDCEKPLYHKGDDGVFHGYFWNIENVYAKKFNCVNVQGHSTILADFLKKLDARSVFVPRFEEVLHIDYGGTEFFKARRSLVFAKHLRQEGDEFRSKFLNSTNEVDKTPYDDDWRKQIPKDGTAHGGPYLGLHMRREDFTYAHQETVPSIEEIGKEVKKMLQKYKISIVYVSTDAPDKEIQELQSHFKANIFRFPRPKDIIKNFKDGGVAIIDQWIVAHARYFIGTCESTFSFRIHEERDILGFNPDTTYNCICGKQSPEDRCHQPTQWRVKFP